MAMAQGFVCLHLSRLLGGGSSSSTHADEEEEEEEEEEEAEGATISSHLAMQRRGLLESLETLIWQVLARSEARLWLCAGIASLQDLVPRHIQTSSLFLDPMRSCCTEGSGSSEVLCKRALRLACEKQPYRVMRLFGKDSSFIRRFFSGHPKRILGWFENFSSSQKRENLLGAQALAHFAFIHRDKYWKELEWKGSHGQSPAIVASKPYYFLDLNVLKTVENFLDYIPEFWSSDELWDSLREGDILSLDMDYFIDKLCDRMKEGSSDVWKMLEQFLFEEDFSGLCSHLLSFFNDEQLLRFINKLRLVLSGVQNTLQKERSLENSWLMQLLVKGGGCPSLDCIMLCNTCLTCSRQLLHMIHEEENLEAYGSIKAVLAKLRCNKVICAQALWPLQREVSKMSKWDMVKLLSLERISLQMLITEECTSMASIELFFSANSISFHHSADGEQSKVKANRKEQWKKKRKKKRKKRRRSDISSDVEGQNSSESDIDYGECSNLTGGEKKWYLTHENFNMVIEKDEIPERVTNSAFQAWLSSLLKQW